MRTAFSLVLLLVTASCYQPSYTGPYACTPATAVEDCPDRWLCIAGLCAPMGDMGMDQGGPPDLSQSACTQGGQLVEKLQNGEVWTCDGNFDPGGYAALCNSASDYHLCGKSPRDQPLLSLLQCDLITGFYLARQDITVVYDGLLMKYFAHCGVPPPPEEKQALLGCGMAPGTVTVDSRDCQGLDTALLCPAPMPGGWACDPHSGFDLASHHSTDGTGGGVLCCKNLR